MATLTLTPTSGMITIGHSFVSPTFTALADDGTTDVSGTVTGPVPAADENTVGVQSLVYTIPAGAGVASDVSATFSLEVLSEALVEFETGQSDRFGNETSGTTYETAVVDANAGTVVSENMAALFDEQALDPQERRYI